MFIARLVSVVTCVLMAAPSYGQSPETRQPVQWKVDFTTFYEYDTNALRYSRGTSDSRWRLFPNAAVQVPLGARATMFFRSAFRLDQYQDTLVLNGTNVSGSAGIARRVAPRLSVWGAYYVSGSEQSDVVLDSPDRFASYTQQGGRGGLVWQTGGGNVLRADGFAVQRRYRGLSSAFLAPTSTQIDPVMGVGASWTRGRKTAQWFRVAMNTIWHQSNNPAYRYVLSAASGAWGKPFGPRFTLRLDGTLATRRYHERRVRLSGFLRRDQIAEGSVQVAWRLGQRVEPFVRVSQRWNRSTDPWRNFSDSRVLVGTRIAVLTGGERRTATRRSPGPPRRTAANGTAGRLGPGHTSLDARVAAKIDLSYVYIKGARWREAAEAARAAVALDPANAIACANLGVALYKLGDLAAARQALERSLSLNPGNDQLRSLLARMPGQP